MTERTTRISFVIFVAGLCLLAIGMVYESRHVILNELCVVHTALLTAPLSVKLAVVIGAITIVNFAVFVLSLLSDDIKRGQQ